MKSPSRTHHSRVTVESAQVEQKEDLFTGTVTFSFEQWDNPRVYPVAYAADALTAVDAIIGAGFDTLATDDRQAAQEECVDG